MTDEERNELQQAVAKSLAAAASAENAAEKSRAQAAAAAGDAAELNARLVMLRQSHSERLQADLKAVPVIGGLLALSSKYFGFSLAVALLLFLLIGPLTYPLLLRAYLALTPTDLRDQYAQVVAAPFLTKAIADLVRQNDDRLDYIQHIPHSWSLKSSEKSPAYAITLVRGQEFSVKLRTRATSSESCLADTSKLDAAKGALEEKDLFTLNLLNPAITRIASGNEAEWIEIRGDESLWKTVPSSAANDAVKAYIRLDKRKAAKVWPCFSAIDTDLLIIVQKSIGHTLPKSQVSTQ